MIRRSTTAALLVCAAALAGCQTAMMHSAGGPPVEGRWASGDGLSVSTLRQGRLRACGRDGKRMTTPFIEIYRDSVRCRKNRLPERG